MFRKVVTLSLIASKNRAFPSPKKYSIVCCHCSYSSSSRVLVRRFLGSAARRPRWLSLSSSSMEPLTARISQSRVLGLSCFPRHPDDCWLQLLCCLVGQCYNCNLLIVEVIVNRMCFLLCCCCCFCSSSPSLPVCTDPPDTQRARSLSAADFFRFLFDCCSVAGLGLVAKADGNLTALK